MKHNFFRQLLVTAAALSVTINAIPASAQEPEVLDKKAVTTKYMRNSVCLIMMEDASVPQKDILRDAFINNKWNNKYNNHNVTLDKRIINPDKLTLTDSDAGAFNLACTPNTNFLELIKSGGTAPKQTFFKEGAFGAIMRELMSKATTTIDTVLKINAARMANKFIVEQDIARDCYNQWMLDAEGNYTDSVILERGLLNATAKAQEIAEASFDARKKLLSENCDMAELFGNTFVVVTRFSYKDKDALVNDRMMPLYAAASLDDSGYGGMALKIAEMGIKASIGKGYYVVVDSYMFRLRWDDAIENEFYGLWNNGEFNKEAYANAKFPALQFIGNERAWAKTRAGVFTNKSEEELIRLAAVDAVDAVLAKFERKDDQFKTKSPLHVIETTDKKGRTKQAYAVQLGSRDGLSGGEVFEVLEVQKKKKDDGSIKVNYIKKGELTVDKKNVWDNSYSTTEGSELSEEEKSKILPYTLLSGKGKQTYYEGMLLRQKTTKK